MGCTGLGLFLKVTWDPICFAKSPLSLFLYLYTIFDQRSVDIIDQVEYGVHDRLPIYPLCGIFYSPWHRHQMEETNGLMYPMRKTQAMWRNRKQTCPRFEVALQPLSYHTPQQIPGLSNVDSHVIVITQ